MIYDAQNRPMDLVIQRGGIPIYSVLRSSSSVKIKVNSQLKIFSIVNGQATISL